MTPLPGDCLTLGRYSSKLRLKLKKGVRQRPRGDELAAIEPGWQQELETPELLRHMWQALRP